MCILLELNPPPIGHNAFHCFKRYGAHAPAVADIDLGLIYAGVDGYPCGDAALLLIKCTLIKVY